MEQKHLRGRYIFFFLGVFSFCTLQNFAQSPYPEINLYRSLLEKEAQEHSYERAFSANNQRVADLPQKTLSGLSAQLISTSSLPDDTQEEYGNKLDLLKQLTEEAHRKGDHEIELSALSEAFSLAFWHEPRDYTRAFVLALELEEKLVRFSDSQFSGRRQAYVKLGEAYYVFREFSKSIGLLQKVMYNIPSSFEDYSRLEALRIAGICYANLPGKMDQSDSCFMALLSSEEPVRGLPVYRALALSNLGCNAMLKGEYEKALALDLEVLPRLKQEKDYGHIAGMYACQGFSYLGLGQVEKLRVVIDSIHFYAHQDNYNRNKRLKQAYTLSAKYYAAIGNSIVAQRYNDTLISLYREEEAKYSSQFISDAVRQVKDRQIASRELELLTERRNLILISLITLLSTLSLSVIVILYRRQQAAYRSLVEQSKRWANEKDCCNEKSSASPGSEPTSEERELMKRIYAMVVERKMFAQVELSIGDLSEELKINRTYISNAINKVTGKNFKTFVNEHRIKESIHIMSDPKNDQLTIDYIAFLSGFANRQSFYEVFKKSTGISPSVFRKDRT